MGSPSRGKLVMCLRVLRAGGGAGRSPSLAYAVRWKAVYKYFRISHAVLPIPVSKKTLQQPRRRQRRGPLQSGASAFSSTSNAVLAPGPVALNRVSPFPVRHRCVLKYGQIFQLTSPTLTALFGTEQKFALNSLFDPDVTGGGHQPYGFDQLAALYRLYKVIRTKVSINVHSAEFGNLILGVQVNQSADAAAITSSSVQTIYERPRCALLFPPYAGTNGPPASLTRVFDIAELDGLSRQQFDADVDTYTANVGADPIREPMLRLGVANLSATVTTYTVWVEVKLEYDTLFSDLVTVAPS